MNKHQLYINKTAVYFFCSTRSSGTEGIRGVENFVAIFASYRGFLPLGTPQANEQTPLLRICTFLLRINTDTYIGCVWQGKENAALLVLSDVLESATKLRKLRSFSIYLFFNSSTTPPPILFK